MRGVALPGECAKCRSRLAPSLDEPLSGVLGNGLLIDGGVCGSLGSGSSSVVYTLGISRVPFFVVSGENRSSGVLGLWREMWCLKSPSSSLLLSYMLLTLLILGILARGLARVGEDPYEEAEETLVTLERRLLVLCRDRGVSNRREEVIAPSKVLERLLASATGLVNGDFWVFMLAKASFDLRFLVSREISACLSSLSTAALAVCCEWVAGEKLSCCWGGCILRFLARLNGANYNAECSSNHRVLIDSTSAAPALNLFKST